DAGIAGLKALDLCSYTQLIEAKAFNFGKKPLSTFKIHWEVNGVYQDSTTVNGNLLSAKDTNIVLNPNFGLSANTSYTFKIWTAGPNNMFDSVPQNDTLKYTINFLGNPNTPSVSDFKQ